jgi:hypothetical protein
MEASVVSLSDASPRRLLSADQERRIVLALVMTFGFDIVRADEPYDVTLDGALILEIVRPVVVAGRSKVDELMAAARSAGEKDTTVFRQLRKLVDEAKARRLTELGIDPEDGVTWHRRLTELADFQQRRRLARSADQES